MNMNEITVGMISLGCAKNQVDSELIVDAHVYARSGARMDRMLTYAKDVKKDLDGHADALFVFAGTNDYNGGVPLMGI